MIIVGTSRAGPKQLGNYLSEQGKNETVRTLEIRGTIAQDVRGAIEEMAALALGTKCEKPLYHAMVNPQPPNMLSLEQCLESVDLSERELGLEGHPRVVILHQKDRRQHLHVAWSRIDIATMRAISDSHNYRKHEVVSRELEKRFGHEHVQGAHHEREGKVRPDRSPSIAELRQQERTGIDGKQVKAEVTASFKASDTAEAFRAALEDKGFILARGDRRDFVIVDLEGGIHSLARRIEGVDTKMIRAFLAPMKVEQLPSVAKARIIAEDKKSGLTPERSDEEWERRLAESAIGKAKRDDAAARRQLTEKKSSRGRAATEKSYSSNDGYASQSSAALKHHVKRQKRIKSDLPRPERPQATVYEQLKSVQAQRARSAKSPSVYEVLKSKFEGKELTDRQLSRIESRIASSIGDGSNDKAADRQPEASGGGRTRSR